MLTFSQKFGVTRVHYNPEMESTLRWRTYPWTYGGEVRWPLLAGDASEVGQLMGWVITNLATLLDQVAAGDDTAAQEVLRVIQNGAKQGYTTTPVPDGWRRYEGVRINEGGQPSWLALDAGPREGVWSDESPEDLAVAFVREARQRSTRRPLKQLWVDVVEPDKTTTVEILGDEPDQYRPGQIQTETYQRQ